MRLSAEVRDCIIPAPISIMSLRNGSHKQARCSSRQCLIAGTRFSAVEVMYPSVVAWAGEDHKSYRPRQQI
jgi:hypothetical protein